MKDCGLGNQAARDRGRRKQEGAGARKISSAGGSGEVRKGAGKEKDRGVGRAGGNAHNARR